MSAYEGVDALQVRGSYSTETMRIKRNMARKDAKLIRTDITRYQFEADLPANATFRPAFLDHVDAIAAEHKANHKYRTILGVWFLLIIVVTFKVKVEISLILKSMRLDRKTCWTLW